MFPWLDYWAANEGNVQSRNEKLHSFYVKKRQDGGRHSQKALHVLFHIPFNGLGVAIHPSQ